MNNGYVIDGEFSVVVGVPIEEHETYEGPYEFTPTEEAQTTETDGKLMEGNITVEKIPDEYIKTDDADALASDIASGKTAYVNGEKLEGTNTFDSDTKQDTATAGDVLFGKTAHSQGSLLVGTMPNNAAEYGFIVDKNDEIDIHKGYHNGNGKVQLDPAMKDRIISENIKPGVNILGVDGSFSSDATANAEDIVQGKTAYKNGQKITGTSTKDSDTSNDTATAADLLEGKTAHSQGQALTGSMANVGAQTDTIDDVNDSISISQGYHNGNGSVQIDSAEKAKIIPGNIKAGADILGVTGTYTSDADAVVGDILEGKTAYIDGQKVTGTMIERGTPTITIGRKDSVGAINEGHYSGGSLVIVKSERDKIIPENIKAGADILGVTGDFTSDADATAEDIANGKTAYVNGEKVTGTASGGDAQFLALVNHTVPFDYDLTDVTYIGKSVFSNYENDVNRNKFSIYAPDVRTIDAEAFKQSNGLSSVTLGYEGVRVEDSAFYNSTLSAIEGLEKASYIGDSAFSGCSLSGTLKVNGQINDYAFGYLRDVEKLIYYGTKIGSLSFTKLGANKTPVVYIENNQSSAIPANAFLNATTVTDVYVPWSSGAVSNAPWGMTNATIHYDTQFDSDGEPII